MPLLPEHLYLQSSLESSLFIRDNGSALRARFDEWISLLQISSRSAQFSFEKRNALSACFDE